MTDAVSLPAGLTSLFQIRDVELSVTGVFEDLGGGRTDRNVDPTYVFRRWQTQSALVSETVMLSTQRFWMGCYGFGRAFQFDDCIDNSFTGSTLAAFSGGTTQLRSTYTNGVNPYYHDVFFPAASSVTLYEDSVEINSSEYTVSTTTGVITYTGSPVPTGTITADCSSFLKPVVFEGPLRISPVSGGFIIGASLREIYPI